VVLISPLITVALCVACIVVGLIIGVAYRKKVGEAAIGSAEEEAKRIINDAIKNSESRKREALIEAKEEIQKMKNDVEAEQRERRNEISRQERRLQQKEESMDRKVEALEQKDEKLNKKIKETEAIKEEIEQIKEKEIEKLEGISGLTVTEAKDYLLASIEQDVKHDAALKIKEIEARLKEEAEEKARDIISLAISRCGADHVSEATVSVVPLPNDEMKGRIIGREGRNIRTLETMTGVDLIIDDTPEAITLSCFDSVRREIARIALEKLIADGRIHPARIEEMVEKARKEVEATMKAEAERATFETGVHGVHPEIMKLLGRLRYRTSYGQNVLDHSIEVAHLSGLIAAELHVNVTAAKRAGLLHDIGKAADHEMEGSHVMIGVELARKYRENAETVNAIAAHHGDVEPESTIAFIVRAADAISAARPGARRESLDSYVKRLENLEAIANSFPGVDKSFAIQAGREIRILVNPEKISDDELVLLVRNLVKKIEDELEYPGQIKVNAVRETKVIDYAK
jgi:ribonuclease Y